ncbi:MAG: PDZ domain-containing protein [Thermoanaerobaculales bacterium]|jgi:hypothetical protein|nr:PDZ domain-containing protein [Thermoanaerobaculales bacterium]
MDRIDPRLNCTASMIVVGLALVTASSEAGELACRVRSVDADATVTLACDGGTVPRVADPVTLGFEAPGVGFVALEGAWEVSLIGPGGEAMASPTAAVHGEPQVGHLARVKSSAAPPPAGPGPSGPRGSITPPQAAGGAHLGVRIEPPGDGEPGVEVVSVTPGGAADAAGVRAGDVVLAIDGRQTVEAGDLVETIRTSRPGASVRLRIFRFPDVIEVDAVLQAGAPEEVPAASDMFNKYFNQPTAAPAAPAPAAPGDHLRRQLASAQVPLPSPAGVYIVGSETGNRSVLFEVDPAIRQIVATSGATPLMLPDDVRLQPGSAPPGEVVSQMLAGRGWLLYLDLSLKWAHIGFAKDRITVTCYDPSGRKQWSDEASNVFAQSRDHSTDILIDKISKKLHKRVGQACLRR